LRRRSRLSLLEGAPRPSQAAERYDRSVSVPCLDAEQRLAWSGALPVAPAALPELIERLHFAVVERYAFGLVRPLRTTAGVSLDLLGRWPAMRFERAGDEVGPGRAPRRYRARLAG
jgi:hypothetical protein